MHLSHSSSSLPPLRIGLIGGGFMGRRHAETMDRVPDLELAAVADPFSSDLSQARNLSHYASWDDMLTEASLDAVIVANPNDQHIPATLACIQAGKPCLVEKPLAPSREELAPLSELLQVTDVQVLVGHHRRHHPAVVAAREKVNRGDLGELVAVNGMWLTFKSDEYFDAAWRREPGAGVVMINAVHDLDLMRHIAGEINAVHAHFSSRRRKFSVADTASVSLQFVNGALGTYICSDTAVSPWTWDQATQDEPAFPYTPDAACYFIAGTEGSLSVPQLANHYYPEPQGNWNLPLAMTYETSEAGDSFTRQLRHFARVARGQEPPLVTVADVAKTMSLMDAVRRSADSGVVVDVDLR